MAWHLRVAEITGQGDGDTAHGSDGFNDFFLRSGEGVPANRNFRLRATGKGRLRDPQACRCTDTATAATDQSSHWTLLFYGAKIRSLNAGGYDINLASPAANMRHKSIEHIKSVIDLAVA
ncbi:hypothetical protein PS3A_38370 [Pseudomonas sp. 3A(2025)]